MKTIVKKDIRAEGKPLIHYWNFCIGAGRANEGLRTRWLRQLKFAVDECGFRYIRFHGLFHDDMFVYRRINNRDVYNWQYIDELFDSLLELGIRPFVELGFCPSDMASGESTQFWWKGNITPPSDYQKWDDLVSKAVQHWIERYGVEEVRQWYFEVWNEPNLKAFWDGSKSEYFELYKVTALCIKKIDSGLRVGGPATSNFVPDGRFAGEFEDEACHMTFRNEDIDDAEWRGVWIEDFMLFCEEQNLPIDFISTHPYPTDFALDSNGDIKGMSRNVSATLDDLSWIRHIVSQSAYSDAEIHLTEWSSSPSPRDCSHDYLPAAAYIVKVNIESSGLVDSLSYWTFTDVFEELGGGETAFHGGFGLINYQNIVKPTFHAYRFLNKLGDKEIARGEGYILTKESTSGKTIILLYNYPENSMPQSVPISYFPNRDYAEKIQSIGSKREFFIEIEGLNPNQQFDIETVDNKHGYVIEKWKEMGSPNSPSREQMKELREMSMLTNKQAVAANIKGQLILNIVLRPWNLVILVES